MNRVVIAAPHSGSGKTTVTLGIMAALRRRGLTLAPFKVGPDFIDPGYHRVATGVDSINLDGWMCPAGFVRETFGLHAANADMAVIEGVMGLFDGIDGSSDAGSTAEVAKLLDAPVLLVVDARSQARSAAALVHGFASFDQALTLAGVIFNNVASPNHERLLREAMAHSCKEVAVLGCLPKDPALSIPSRHLGLLTAEENPLPEEFLAHLAETMERHLDLDALLAISAGNPEEPEGGAPAATGMQEAGTAFGGSGKEEGHLSAIRIAVARDAAFCFTYPDNLRLLREEGAEITFFSPLVDSQLPQGISGVYLPGGYPEMFAATLAANGPMKESVRQAVDAGIPLYAECGGFIYLTRGVTNEESAHPFVGIFPVQTRMLSRRKALGYREIKLLADGVIGEEGATARGHEFHYSEMEEMPPGIDRLYTVSRKGSVLGREGFRYRNCLASYIHLHFGSCPEIPVTFMRHCKAYTEGSLG